MYTVRIKYNIPFTPSRRRHDGRTSRKHYRFDPRTDRPEIPDFGSTKSDALRHGTANNWRTGLLMRAGSSGELDNAIE